ncbi:hypothetical protein [Saliniramus sp.]|uniref:hypothetical protein n=1 Tax=Saliniramus sp. TaxID=2986772 RepID=UPI002BCE0711|nr:hypothetical protein [Saliniramus sp.]HMB12078.1 hypothetical protein [Saliniramus sp.]
MMLAGLPNPVSNIQSNSVAQPNKSAATDQAFASAMQGVGDVKSTGPAVPVNLVGTLLPEMRAGDFEQVMLAVRRDDQSALNSRVQEHAFDVVKTLQEAGIPVDNSGNAYLREDDRTLAVLARIIADYPFSPNEGGGFPTYHPTTDIGPRLKEHFSPEFVDRMLEGAANYRDPTRRDNSI